MEISFSCHKVSRSLHGTVANLAFHFGAQVLLVAKEYKSRQLIQPRPGKGLLIFLELRQLLNRRAVGLDTLVAHHAIGGLGNLHFIAVCRHLMAGVAIHSILNVELVTEGDGLRHRLGGRRDLRRFTPEPRRNRSRLSLWSPLHDNVRSFRNEGVRGEDIGAGGIGIEIPARPGRHHHELLFRFLPHDRSWVSRARCLRAW